MGFLRGTGRFILYSAVGIMVTLWIVAAVTQATLLNRQVVKRWFATSGVYQNLVASAINLQPMQGFVNQNDIKGALQSTYTPDYIQKQTETAIDATYDWIDGKTPNINFSLPVQDKRNDFIANLQKGLLPRIQALPTCTSASQVSSATPTCLPPGSTAQDIAKQYSQLSDSSDFLNKPISPESMAQSGQAPSNNLSYIPKLASATRMSVYILPILIIICGAGYALLTSDKLLGVIIIGRRIFFQGLILTIAGGGIWYLGTHIDITGTADGDTAQLALVKGLINPVLQHVVPDIGITLATFSSLITILGAGAWIGGHLAKQRIIRNPKITPTPPPTPAVTLPNPQKPSNKI